MGTPEPRRERDQRSSRFCTKRMIVQSALLLAAGAIVNVAVAWVCARWNHPRSNPTRQSHAAQSVYVSDPTGQYSGRCFYVEKFSSFAGICICCSSEGLMDESEHRKYVADQVRQGTLVERLDLPSWASAAKIEWSESPLTTRVREDAFGWPFLTLRCYYERELQPPRGPGPEVLREGIRMPDLIPSRSAIAPRSTITVGLPLRPIWPGFAVNTAFYAVITWMLFAVPGALRRKRRRARGLCPRCAYDLRGRVPQSLVCPECGEAATRAATTA